MAQKATTVQLLGSGGPEDGAEARNPGARVSGLGDGGFFRGVLRYHTSLVHTNYLVIGLSPQN